MSGVSGRGRGPQPNTVPASRGLSRNRLKKKQSKNILAMMFKKGEDNHRGEEEEHQPLKISQNPNVRPLVAGKLVPRVDTFIGITGPPTHDFEEFSDSASAEIKETASDFYTIDSSSTTNSDWSMGSVSGASIESMTNADTQSLSPDIPPCLLGQITHLAQDICGGNGHDPEWIKYLQCYTKGQYTVNSPPDPPEFGPDFQYLPALCPPNEAHRITACTRSVSIFNYLPVENFEGHLESLRRYFPSCKVSLSSFSQTHETFKISALTETGSIPRSLSPAAHILYSSEMLVVLDVNKDWRFRRNNMLLAYGIRFFVVAPLLTKNGEVFGIVSLFDTAPYEPLTVQERRLITMHCGAIMDEIDDFRDDTADYDDSMVSDLSTDHSHASSASMASVMESEMDADNAQLPLRYHQTQTGPGHERIFLRGNSKETFSSAFEYTPPSTAGTVGEVPFVQTSEGPGPRPKVKRSILCQHNSPILSVLAPFSGSDITSIYQQPPNTPTPSFQGDERAVNSIDLTQISHGKFDQTSNEDSTPESNKRTSGSHQSFYTATQESPESLDRVMELPSQYKQPASSRLHEPQMKTKKSQSTIRSVFRRPIVNHSSSLMPKTSIDSLRAFSDATGIQVEVTVREKESDLIPFTLTRPHQGPASSRSQPSVSQDDFTNYDHVKVEVERVLSKVAEEWDWDIIYVVDFKPDPNSQVENALRSNLVASFGILPYHFHPDTEFHTKLLQGALHHLYKNKLAKFGDGHVSEGVLHALDRDRCPKYLCSAGMIVGAYRKPKSTKKFKPTSKTTELHNLVILSQTIKNLLRRTPAQSALHAQKQMYRSFPTSRYPSGFPANEATVFNPDTTMGTFDSKGSAPLK